MKRWPGIASLFTQFGPNFPTGPFSSLVPLLSKAPRLGANSRHVRSQHMITTTKLCLTWIPPRNLHYKAEAFVQLQLSGLNFDRTFTLLSVIVFQLIDSHYLMLQILSPRACFPCSWSKRIPVILANLKMKFFPLAPNCLYVHKLALAHSFQK